MRSLTDTARARSDIVMSWAIFFCSQPCARSTTESACLVSPARAAYPRRSARAQLVVEARSKDLRKVRRAARYCQKPTVDPHDRTLNTQTRVIEMPIR